MPFWSTALLVFFVYFLYFIGYQEIHGIFMYKSKKYRRNWRILREKLFGKKEYINVKANTENFSLIYRYRITALEHYEALWIYVFIVHTIHIFIYLLTILVLSQTQIMRIMRITRIIQIMVQVHSIGDYKIK